MGYRQHLEWLLEGVEAWNVRRAREYFRPDLEGFDIRQAFTDAGKMTTRKKIPLTGANLMWADLREADLREADLKGADLRRADLRKADLFGAKLQKAVVRGARLREADLSEADLSEAELRKANLRGADLGGAHLSGADLGGADLRRADLSEADLRKADLSGADLSGADLSRADLRGADLRGASVRSIVTSATDTNDAEFTDMLLIKGLTQDQIDFMLGDSGTILPSGVTRPEHWPDLDADLPVQAEPDANDAQGQTDALLLPFQIFTPAIEVRWVGDMLDADVRLDAFEPAPKQFHPPVAPSAQMDLLASLGQIARQISKSLTANASDNSARITGDAAVIFDAIHDEVKKPDGTVLSFVIDFNLTMVAALARDEDYGALSDVDQTYIKQFLGLGQQWRQANGIIQEITNPLDLSILPDGDALETLKLGVEEMIGFITDDGNARYFAPSLRDVTREMSIYPWDPDDPEVSNKKRLVAFGTFFAELYKALKSPPAGVKIAAGLVGFIGSLASILGLYYTLNS